MLFFTKTYFCNNIFDMDQIRTTMFKKKKSLFSQCNSSSETRPGPLAALERKYPDSVLSPFPLKGIETILNCLVHNSSNSSKLLIWGN